MRYEKVWQAAELVRLLYKLKIIHSDVLYDIVDDLQIAYWEYEEAIRET